MKKRFLSLALVAAMIVASFSAFGAFAATNPVQSTAISPSIKMSKTTFALGEQINITYEGIAEDNTWLCIYPGTGAGQTHDTYVGRAGTDPSRQYIYIGGETNAVTVPFNNLTPGDSYSINKTKLDPFDKTPNIFWYRADIEGSIPELLAVGKYHAVVLGGGDWYNIKTNYIDFEVVDGPINVASIADITGPGEYKLIQNIDNADTGIVINSGNYVIDLNGFTLASTSSTKQSEAITVNGGTVTIKDTSAAQTGLIHHKTNDVICMNDGELTLENIKILGEASGCDGVFIGGGKVTVNNCYIKVVSSAIHNSKAAGTVTVNGGIYKASNALKVKGNAIITVNSAICFGALLDQTTTPPTRPSEEVFVAGNGAKLTTQDRIDPDGNVASAKIFYVLGDLNGDSKIAGADSALLLQYLAGWNIENNFTKAAADVNADGSVNGKDITLMLQYLAGWDVEFGSQTPAARWDDLDWTTPAK